MKLCTVCKQTKPLTDFNKKSTNKDGYQTLCRLCSNERSRNYYKNNHELHRQNVKRNTQAAAKVAREFLVQYFTEHPCVDCGFSDIRALEFDHVRGERRAGVAAMARSGYSMAAIQEEIAKCEVRCKNCHAIATFERLGGTWHDSYLDVTIQSPLV